MARDDARAELAQLRSMLRARVATVPDAKDVAGTPGLGSSSALGVTGVMGHPGVAKAIADSALCLLVGTQLSVTARAGLDDVLASVPTYSIGSASPFVPCTHVQTEDLRGSLRLLDAGVERRRPADWRAGAGRGAEGPSCNRRRTTATACGTARRWLCWMPRCPMASTSSSTPGTSARRRSTTYPPAGTDDSSSRSAWAAWDTASAPRWVWRSDGRRRTVVIAGDGSFFMHGMEIHTALQYGLPVTFLLFDNHAHAMCVTREQLFYDDLYSYNRFGAEPARRRAGGHVPRPVVGRRRRRSTICPRRCRPRSTVDGPSVVAVECSADEIPPFANFLGKAAVKNPVITEEISSHVVARA